ncbi:prepilin peptidase [Helicobacter mustelae]|uniref:Putative Type IV prepilin peptidase n=1 Tax=Helicobacter mustelae (strain ATCC 43772 / CCUG 25715 / CIP 103759 / LMG 18044 / NCTC 12198 / R85-136P) TaxID=679897 RepID=D3UH24_HELM1|nr:prepilin peptidase [Helicobacter mustelae]CBG39796.1 Putative Type IV prepilin peptidase [Helicobacter mustelae 12198]SQH71304.1 Type IV prepilin peptidase [Helicobacter mustelae]
MNFLHFGRNFDLVLDFGFKPIFWTLPLFLAALYGLLVLHHFSRLWLLPGFLVLLGIFFAFPSFFAMIFGGFFALAFLLALTDWRDLAVPTWLNFSLVVLGFVALFGVLDPWQRLLESFGLLGIFAFLQNLGRYFMKKEMLGDGDLIFVLGLCLVFGWVSSMEAIFLGSVFGMFFVCIRGRVPMPFISFMSIGIFFDFLLGLLDV